MRGLQIGRVKNREARFWSEKFAVQKLEKLGSI
jgi:hypothetical protein